MNKVSKYLLLLFGFVFAFFAVVSIVLTIIFPSLYSLIIAYIVGSIVSIILFKLTNKNIDEAYYLDLKKAIKKIHAMHQLIYLLMFLGFAFIFKNVFTIIALTIGLLLMKIAIVFTNKKDEKNANE